MKHLTLSGFLLIAVLTSGCSPDGRRAGLLLGGDEAPFPADWRFTDDFKEISIQVHTPYLIPHAVTIWCAQVNGQFYVGASRPTTKHWPGWVDTDPNVRLRIGDQVYFGTSRAARRREHDSPATSSVRGEVPVAGEYRRCTAGRALLAGRRAKRRGVAHSIARHRYQLATVR